MIGIDIEVHDWLQGMDPLGSAHAARIRAEGVDEAEYEKSTNNESVSKYEGVDEAEYENLRVRSTECHPRTSPSSRHPTPTRGACRWEST